MDFEGELTFEEAVELLRSFYYEKNGKELTIMFLKMIIEKLGG